MEFLQPPILLNEKGLPRKAGFELEYGSTDLDTTTSCIIELFGGTEFQINTFHREIRNTSLGTFCLKMDSRILTDKLYEGVLKKFGINSDEKVEDLVESIASWVVPYEIGTPALPFQDIHRLDELRRCLLEKKAQGTKASILNAYATHINAELPALNVETVLLYLRAFLLLYPWLLQESKIAFSRRMTSFIDPFPDDYTRLVLQPGYNPDITTLIEDYHDFNPDRNRPLDLYPVFTIISAEQITQFSHLGNVKPRPTFHYRLPNSLVDEPDWSFANEWNRWVAVEKLAARPELIRSLSREYLVMDRNTFIGFSNKWIKRTEEWIKAYESA